MAALDLGGRPARDERGVVFPSPVVILSVLAVAMAGIAFVATRDAAPDRARDHHHLPAGDHADADGGRAAPQAREAEASRTVRTARRSTSSSTTTPTSPGLAGQVAARASRIGWQVVGSDNWYGTIPASTVYYPKRLEKAGKLLALDLGIQRTAPAVDPMRLDRLTVILTGPLD